MFVCFYFWINVVITDVVGTFLTLTVLLTDLNLKSVFVWIVLFLLFSGNYFYFTFNNIIIKTVEHDTAHHGMSSSIIVYYF